MEPSRGGDLGRYSESFSIGGAAEQQAPGGSRGGEERCLISFSYFLWSVALKKESKEAIKPKPI